MKYSRLNKRFVSLKLTLVTAVLLAASIIELFVPTVSMAVDEPTASCSPAGTVDPETQWTYSEWGISLYNPNAAVCCIDSGGSGVSVTPGSVTGTVSSFVDLYGQYAFNVGKHYGIPYEAILGQAGLESGWGKSRLTTEAFNFFGIKAGSSWTGPTITMRTAEQRPDGSVYYIDAKFRRYANAEAGFTGYAEFIHANSRYKTALNYPNDPFKYIEEIKAAGYATDVKYVAKVSSIIATIQKYIADKGLFPPSSAVVPDATPPSGEASSSAATPPLVCNTPISSANTNDVVRIAEEELARHPIEYDATVLSYSDGVREAWCADFVSYVFNKAGSPFTGGSSGGWRIAAVLSMQAWFRNSSNGSLYFAVGSQLPQPGDVAFYIGAQTPDGGSTRHVNIVVSVDAKNGTMVTIGGNESNTVRKQTREIKLDASGLVGFGRKAKTYAL